MSRLDEIQGRMRELQRERAKVVTAINDKQDQLRAVIKTLRSPPSWCVWRNDHSAECCCLACVMARIR